MSPAEGADERRRRQPAPVVTGRSWALVLLAVGGALAALGASQPWVRLLAEDALSVDEVAVTGSALAPLTTAAGLVGLAAVVAVLAVRSWLRVFVGVDVLVLSGLALAKVVSAAGDLPGAARDWWRVEVAALADSASAETTAWWTVSAAGLVLLMAGSGVVLAYGRRWSGLSSRYERPDAVPRGPQQVAEPTEAQYWQALDRGEDPTASDEPPHEPRR